MTHVHTLEVVISTIKIPFQPEDDPSRKLAEVIEVRRSVVQKTFALLLYIILSLCLLLCLLFLFLLLLLIIIITKY